MKKAATVAERDYMSRVAALGCVLCHHLDLGHTEPELHHVREGQGMSQRAQHFLVIPLCAEHHRGASGFHSRTFYTRFRLDEMDLLAMTIERLQK